MVLKLINAFILQRTRFTKLNILQVCDSNGTYNHRIRLIRIKTQTLRLKYGPYYDNVTQYSYHNIYI